MKTRRGHKKKAEKTLLCFERTLNVFSVSRTQAREHDDVTYVYDDVTYVFSISRT